MDILGLSGRAVRNGDVGDEHCWEGRRVTPRKFRDRCKVRFVEGDVVALAGAAGDFDGGAVHVHLPVADFVEPGPGEGVCARLDALGDGKAVRIRIRGRSGVVGSDVAGDAFGGAAALDGVDDHPGGALGGGVVGRERDLAGSAAVDGFTEERKLLGRTDGHVCDCCAGVAGGFAGEVGTVGSERAVVGTAVWWGRGHDHVSMGFGCEESED